jgi:DNA-binding NarL/FixJ family response regulator
MRNEVAHRGKDIRTFEGEFTAIQTRTLQMLGEGLRQSEICKQENINRHALEARLNGIAQKLGISRLQLLREFSMPEGPQLIIALLERRLARIETMLEKALAKEHP